MSSPSEAPTPATGKLSITGPHMTAELVVLNHRLEPVVKGVGTLEPLELPPGLYDVQATVGGAKAYYMVRLTPGGSVAVEASDWNMEDVRFSSAAPLTGTSTTHEWQTDPAEKWSRQTTWTSSGAGSPANSRLFIFVRTLDPREHRGHFAQGLELLDCDGRLITKLEGPAVQAKPESGWMAFCADLPAGPYILHRRQGSGVRPRYQPLYLCPEWETQVFVPSGRQPSLRKLSLIYARRGEGFVPDDSQDKAAEAVLAGLRRGCNLATAEQMRNLLEHKLERPWLGVLAAHAMRLQSPGGTADSRTGRDRSQAATYQEKDAGLYRKVVERISALLPNHPDVQALRLVFRESNPSFPFPPLLQSGLFLARQLETELGVDFIPADSLTDCALDRLYANSVWTGWGPLARAPQPLAESSPPALRGGKRVLLADEVAGTGRGPAMRSARGRTLGFSPKPAAPADDTASVVDALAIVALNRVRLRRAVARKRSAPTDLKARDALAVALAAWTLQKQPGPGVAAGEQAPNVPLELAVLAQDLDPETLCQSYGLPRARAAQVLEPLKSSGASFITDLLEREVAELKPEEQAITDHLKHRLSPDLRDPAAGLDSLIEQVGTVLSRLDSLEGEDWTSPLRDDLLAAHRCLARRGTLLAVTSADGEILLYKNPPFAALFSGGTSLPEGWRELQRGSAETVPLPVHGDAITFKTSRADVIDQSSQPSAGRVLARLYRAVPPDPPPALKDLAAPQKHATCLLTSLDLFDYRAKLNQERAEEYRREMVNAASRLRQASEELNPLAISV